MEVQASEVSAKKTVGLKLSFDFLSCAVFIPLRSFVSLDSLSGVALPGPKF